MCPCSHWLRWHCVSVVVDYVDTAEIVVDYLDTWTRCLCSCWLRRHGQDYTDTFKNFEGFSQIFKEQSGEKKVLGCVFKPNSNNIEIWNHPFLKKFACLCSRWLRWYTIFELCDRISSRKRKRQKVRKTVFACSYGAQAESVKQSKKMVENLVTLSFCKYVLLKNNL